MVQVHGSLAWEQDCGVTPEVRATVDNYLRATGLIRYIVPGSLRWQRNGYLLRLVAEGLSFLRANPHFIETGWLFGLGHLNKVGWPLTDFRSRTKRLLPWSLHVTFGLGTGRVWVDVDRFNPAQHLVGFLGHLFVDVLWDRTQRIGLHAPGRASS